MKGYYMESIHQFWQDGESSYHWEIAEDSDGLDQIEVRYCERGKVHSRVSIPLEIVDQFAKKMIEMKNKVSVDV